ncbi:hypothetical protein MASS_0353 [Mycobacteroides abscessus subsp. bolletii 50594]|uniref:Uncharacterized protein n=1 Tax=Mycobacteroides abscessus subsp. bolletii 50594 TaxID=1303024 RepID=A0AB33A5A5_9MYCO|nr:hypothetical protein MASS_0353 [Mycobacteroides abscessus subsp. bolletii 50594]
MSQSRIDDVVAGALTLTEVDLVNIDDPSSRPLRDALEEFGIKVHYHPVGQPRHIVTARGSDRAVARFVVLGCHGDEGRILLPELGKQVDPNSRKHSWTQVRSATSRRKKHPTGMSHFLSRCCSSTS